MQTEGRDASLRAIFAEVQLILCKSKTINGDGENHIVAGFSPTLPL